MNISPVKSLELQINHDAKIVSYYDAIQNIHIGEHNDSMYLITKNILTSFNVYELGKVMQVSRDFFLAARDLMSLKMPDLLAEYRLVQKKYMDCLWVPGIFGSTTLSIETYLGSRL